MHSHLRSLAARVLVVIASVSPLVACSDDPTSPDGLAGTYAATAFLVTPTGQPAIDVLTNGGTLTLTFTGESAVTGTLSLPSSVTGDAPMNESMTGTYVRTGSTLQFTQSADTFVRDLDWTVEGSSLTVVNQEAGSARFTITLTRQ